MSTKCHTAHGIIGSMFCDPIILTVKPALGADWGVPPQLWKELCDPPCVDIVIIINHYWNFQNRRQEPYHLQMLNSNIDIPQAVTKMHYIKNIVTDPPFVVLMSMSIEDDPQKLFVWVKSARATLHFQTRHLYPAFPPHPMRHSICRPQSTYPRIKHCKTNLMFRILSSFGPRVQQAYISNNALKVKSVPKLDQCCMKRNVFSNCVCSALQFETPSWQSVCCFLDSFRTCSALSETDRHPDKPLHVDFMNLFTWYLSDSVAHNLNLA